MSNKSTLYTLIKKAVREAVKEELSEILIETLNQARKPQAIQESYMQQPTAPMQQDVSSAQVGLRDMYKNMMQTGETPTFTAQQAAYVAPRGANTSGEGSALPQGEVSLDQIFQFVK